jgi:hypothetical protein
MDDDRHVNEWVHSGKLHGLWGAGVMLIFAIVAIGAGLESRPLPDHPLLLIVLAMALGFFGGRLVGRAVLGGSGAAAQQVYLPQAAGTYVKQYSHIDALAAQGNHAGAADAWEKVAIAEPMNPWPLIRAGEIYMRQLGDPTMALERFLGARSVPGVGAEQELYATQKIVDLYLGPLNDTGRALVELRRLSVRYAGSREANAAREAIARLKADRNAPDERAG